MLFCFQPLFFFVLQMNVILHSMTNTKKAILTRVSLKKFVQKEKGFCTVSKNPINLLPPKTYLRRTRNAFVSFIQSLQSGLQQLYQSLTNLEACRALSETFISSKKVYEYRREAQACLNATLVLRNACRAKKSSSKAKRKKILKRRRRTSNKPSSRESLPRINNQTKPAPNDEINSRDSSFPAKTSNQITPENAALSNWNTSFTETSFTESLNAESLSQWNFDAFDPLFAKLRRDGDYDDRKSFDIKQSSYSSWSNSSYEIISLSASQEEKKAQNDILHNSARSPSLSSTSKADLKTSHSLVSTTQTNTNGDEMKKCPFFTVFTPLSNSYSGICLNFNKQCLTSQPWGGTTKVKMPYSSRDNSTFESCNSCLKKEVKKVKAANVLTQANVWQKRAIDFDCFNGTIRKTDPDFQQVFRHQEQTENFWPIRPAQCRDIWDTNREVPVLNSLKKSFKTESSFNFDDSRFNSLTSEKDCFGANKSSFSKLDPLLNEKVENGILCDFSHFLNSSTSPKSNQLDIESNKSNLISRYLDFPLYPNIFSCSTAELEKNTTKFNVEEFSNCSAKIDSGAQTKPLDKLLCIFQSQRNEINALRKKLAKESVVMAEHGEILRRFHKETIVKAQEIQKQTENKLVRARQKEIVRYNSILDKEVLKLYNLQRRRHETKAREYKIKNYLKWKPYEK